MHYDVLKTLGDCHAAMDQRDQARECYLEAAVLEPALPGHQIGLGILALLEGRLDEAAKAFEGALAAEANCPDAHWGMALVHWQRREYPQAVGACLRYVERQGDNRQAVRGLFHMGKRAGDLAVAAKFLDALLQKHPGDTPLLLCQAEIQAARGDAGAARQTLLGILALEPQNAQAAQLLAELKKAAT